MGATTDHDDDEMETDVEDGGTAAGVVEDNANPQASEQHNTIAATPVAASSELVSPSYTTPIDHHPGQENTGRWTKLEHAAFLKGIEKFGKEWKKVAALVQTRTVMQTRTHAQKYYEKLAKVANAASGGTGEHKFIATTSSRLSNGGAAGSNSTGNPLKLPAKVDKKNEPKKSQPLDASLCTSMTDSDILVPISDATALRSANKEYMDMMKANCFLFHALPLTEQAWLVRNLVHFLAVVRGRRWISHVFDNENPSNNAGRYRLISDPSTVIQNDFRMDPLKIAAWAFHPYWLLGENDLGNAHNGRPFIHRTVDGSWKSVSTAQVREILKGEGLKNLLLLPPSVHMAESAGSTTATASVAAARPVAATAADGKEGEGVVESEHAAEGGTVDAAAEADTTMDDGNNEESEGAVEYLCV